MLVARIALLVSALTFTVFGVLFLWRPAEMASAVDLGVESATARPEIRAMYGGFELGIAAFLFWCLRDPALVRAGLVFSLCAFVGLGSARAIGLAIEGTVPAIMLKVVIAEAAAAALSLWGLVAMGRE